MEGLEKLFVSMQPKNVVLKFEGTEIPITIRELSWSQKSKAQGDCFSFHEDGTVVFDFDKYNKSLIKQIITNAPWGETNEVFLNQVKASFGTELEKLIPKAFEDVKANNFLAKESAK